MEKRGICTVRIYAHAETAKEPEQSRESNQADPPQGREGWSVFAVFLSGLCLGTASSMPRRPTSASVECLEGTGED